VEKEEETSRETSRGLSGVEITLALASARRVPRPRRRVGDGLLAG